MDGLRPDAYRYRDYVIRAFNDDLPYDRFVRQQLAGDELEPDNTDALIATGFFRCLPRNQRLESGAAAAGDSRRRHRKYGVGVPGTDDRMCAAVTITSSIRSRKRLLPPAGVLRRDLAARRSLDRVAGANRVPREADGELGEGDEPLRDAIDHELADEREAAMQDAISAYDPDTSRR